MGELNAMDCENPEMWRSICGYEGLYCISNQGNVKSLSRRDSRGAPVKECILKPNVGTTGYLYVNLRKHGKVKHKKIHRLIAEAFLPKVPGKTFVNHIDGNKLNNHPANLEWCTQSENVAHAYKNGFMIAGENQKAASEGRKKPVNQYDLQGNYIATYQSGVDAIKRFGMSSACLSLCCHGKIKTSQGYIWKFAEEAKK